MQVPVGLRGPRRVTRERRYSRVVLAYKFTRPGGQGAFTGFHWPLPQIGEPGDWVRAQTAEVCVAGIHACRAEQLPHWLGPELWVIELSGEVTESPYKLVALAGRLVSRVRGWPSAERGFAEACAARTLDLAVSALRDAGLDAHAEAAAAAAGTADLLALADVVRGDAAPLVATLVGYAADCAWDIDNGYFAMCAYVAATAFASHSTGDVVQDMSSQGWVQERARQARWLAAALDLS
jgi:hypothetical protein